MLFNFRLTPVAEVIPWSHEGHPYLSWFGLTCGQYWINVGDHTLLEYAQQIQCTDSPRYYEYQVARIYDDILDMLPHVLEEVPAPLVKYASIEFETLLADALPKWDAHCKIAENEDEYWEALGNATEWLRLRRLTCDYLAPSAHIMIWSHKDQVHIEWDHRDKIFNGHPAWTALHGQHTLPREEFIQEVISFHERLTREMATRVQQVILGHVLNDIKIDLKMLQREQKIRSLPLNSLLAVQMESDWPAVGGAIKKILDAAESSIS